MYNIKLKFEEEVYEYIVDMSLDLKLGARGLRSIIEGILTDAMFELPSKKDVRELSITLDYARQKFRKSNIAKLKVA